MSPVRCLLLPVLVLVLVLRPAELRGLRSELEAQRSEDAGEAAAKASVSPERSPVERVARGAKGGGSRRRDPPSRDDDPGGYFTTPRAARRTAAPPGNGSRTSRGPGLLNPLFPVTDGSYLAYTVMLLALVLFAAGIVGNLALMCIVWHSFYLKSAWNCVLAGLAFWDFLVLFFCLPVVVFHELTLTRLLGDLSCRLVPYLEVTSLGVATFSLCALSIDRFHAATGPGAHQSPKVEPCRSILSKLAVIFVGSMVLAAPELLLWQLLQESVGLPAPPAEPQQNQASGSLMAAFRARTDALKVDVCVREPSAELPEGVYSLVLTYHQARMWWIFGCYLCLPLLFTLACDLVTRHVLAQRLPGGAEKVAVRCSDSSSTKKKQRQARQARLRSTVLALTGLYVACSLPESVCNITLAYVSGPASARLPPLTLPALGLVGHFLLFARCSATPVLLLCLCRSLGQAFMDCCCCCCEECLPDGSSSSSASSTAAASSTLSSPSPSSLAPSGKEEAVKALATEVTAFNRAKDSPAAIGTPC